MKEGMGGNNYSSYPPSAIQNPGGGALPLSKKMRPDNSRSQPLPQAILNQGGFFGNLGAAPRLGAAPSNPNRAGPMHGQMTSDHDSEVKNAVHIELNKYISSGIISPDAIDNRTIEYLGHLCIKKNTHTHTT